jgi:hypothetical protein
MPRCNPSEYALHFPDCDDVLGELGIDAERVSPEEERAVVDLLLDRGIGFQAIYRGEDVGGGFVALDSLANTGELADRHGVACLSVVHCIDAGLLTGLKTPNGFWRLLVKDAKFDSITKEEIVSVKIPRSPSNKTNGRGLKKAIGSVLSSSPPSGEFGISHVRSALRKEGWKQGVNYSRGSDAHAMKGLEYDGLVVLTVASGKVMERRWKMAPGVRPAPATVADATPQQINQSISRLTDEIADRILEIGAAKAAARISMEAT